MQNGDLLWTPTRDVELSTRVGGAQVAANKCILYCILSYLSALRACVGGSSPIQARPTYTTSQWHNIFVSLPGREAGRPGGEGGRQGREYTKWALSRLLLRYVTLRCVALRRVELRSLPLCHLHVDASSVRHDENNGAENVTGNGKDVCSSVCVCV